MVYLGNAGGADSRMDGDGSLVSDFLYRNNHVALCIVDEHKILQATESFATILGFEKGELVGFPLEKLFTAPYLEKIVASIRKREGATFDYVEVLAKHGGVKIVRLFLENLSYNGEEISILNVVDTTKEIVFKSFYRMLSAINKSIIHNSDLEKFFEDVCGSLTKVKYIELAWALEFNEKGIKVLSYSGISKHVEYAVKAVEESMETGNPAPVYSSLKDGKIKIVKNVLKDDKIKPYREALLSQGFKSVCYIPVQKDGEYRYALCLYSSVPYFFDDYVIPVLEEMQLDMNFFLSNLKELTFKNIFYEGIKSSSDWVLVTDVDGVILYANEAVSKISGYDINEIVGRKPSIFKSDKYDEEFYKSLWETILLGKIYKGVIINRTKKGDYYQLYHTIVPVKKNGEITHFIAISKDLSREVYLEEQVRKFKYYDQLTDLLNAEGFIRECEETLNNIEIDSVNYAVLVVDIYDFNRINKIYGVYTADRILKEIGHRLLKKNKIVGRLGDDEFILFVVFEDFKRLKDLILDIIEDFEDPIEADNQNVDVGINIGIAVHKSKEKHDLRSLISNANTAVNLAKRQGRGKFRFFDDAMNKLIQRDFEVQRLIAESLQRGYFTFHLQPIYRSVDESIAEFESLVRIDHPHKGMIYPGEFIEFLERSYYLVDFERYLLDRMVEYLTQMKEEFGKAIPLGVNLSMEGLNTGRTLDLLMDIKNEYVEYLTLEITERIFSKDIERAQDILLSLKDMGFRIMIDDFGTGYSSLSYIHKLPVDAIKVDIGFIREMMENVKVKELVKEIVRMSKVLGIETVAEGVETKEQVELLKEFGCDYLQGYYFSKPLPFYEVKKLLAVMEGGYEGR